ncbi:ATP12 family protein [uncultured Sneathiella sp.]|uniref:ATP12 family chaperone protein n=1 Tax=uncultured Sneathiella sp. TaxID=879315 RepID=UPI0030EC0BC1|tara:strand:- start:15014 stop:15715 length:702 start_codon:yes stop_codon:yes gene_type:complete
MKRFYKTVTAEEDGGVYSVCLDGRVIKTPAKAHLRLPTRALAEAIAGEWNAQSDKIEPANMPLMQAAATAIDRVTPQREKVIDEIAAYGGSDMVCYRACYPVSLVEKQAAAWDPMLAWIKNRHQVTLHVAEGIMHIQQPGESLAKLRALVSGQQDMTLAPLYNITALCGSLVIALAVLDGRITAEDAFEISEIDETHAMEQWGSDAEAVKRRENNKESLAASARFLQLSGIIA